MIPQTTPLFAIVDGRVCTVIGWEKPNSASAPRAYVVPLGVRTGSSPEYVSSAKQVHYCTDEEVAWLHSATKEAPCSPQDRR